MALIGATSPVTAVLCVALQLYTLCIFGVIILSWFPLSPGGPGYTIWRVLQQITDPVLLPLRRLIPPIGGMFDLSPIIVLVIVQIIHGQIC
jgi:YggT family protein